MPDETIIPDPRQPHAEANVNVTTPAQPDTGILSGLGQYKSIVALGFAGIVAGAFWLLLWTGIKMLESAIADQRADRLAEQQLFRESVKDIQHEADRRAGEVKGSTDKLIDVVRENSGIIRQWIDESRRERMEHGKPPRSAELKPPMP